MNAAPGAGEAEAVAGTAGSGFVVISPSPTNSMVPTPKSKCSFSPFSFSSLLLIDQCLLSPVLCRRVPRSPLPHVTSSLPLSYVRSQVFYILRLRLLQPARPCLLSSHFSLLPFLVLAFISHFFTPSPSKNSSDRSTPPRPFPPIPIPTHVPYPLVAVAPCNDPPIHF